MNRQSKRKRCSNGRAEHTWGQWFPKVLEGGYYRRCLGTGCYIRQDVEHLQPCLVPDIDYSKFAELDEKPCSHWFIPYNDKSVQCVRCWRLWPFRQKSKARRP